MENNGIRTETLCERASLLFRQLSNGRMVSRWGGQDVLVDSVLFNPRPGVAYDCMVLGVNIGDRYFYTAEPTGSTKEALSFTACSEPGENPEWCTGNCVALLTPVFGRDGRTPEAFHQITGKRIRFIPGSRIWMNAEPQLYLLEEEGRVVNAFAMVEPPKNALTTPEGEGTVYAYTVPKDIEVTFRRRDKGVGMVAFHPRFPGLPIFPAWGTTVVVGERMLVLPTQNDRHVIGLPSQSVKVLKELYGGNVKLYTTERPTNSRNQSQRGGRPNDRKPQPQRRPEAPKTRVEQFREKHGPTAPVVEKAPAKTPCQPVTKPESHRPLTMAEQLVKVKMTEEE